MVDSPIVSSDATRVVLRPTRSPKCPKSAEPIGRAKKAIPKVASEDNIAVVESEAGKKRLGKTRTAAVA
jgi:hypothetical protein